MKPLIKFNNGNGALLCNNCRVIMLTGDKALKSNKVLCEECIKNIDLAPQIAKISKSNR